MLEEYKNHDTAVYGGYINDREKLMACSSGGIATALAEQILTWGGVIAGVKYTDDFHDAEYILVDDQESLEQLKGSKYLMPLNNNIFDVVKGILSEGRIVFFMGLPCVIAALYRFLNSRPENLYTCELVCHGATNKKVHQEYVSYLEKRYGSRIVEFSAHHKKEDYSIQYLYARFSNGKVFEKPFYDTEYGYAFSIYGQPSCYQCRFKGNNRKGDIMIGDFHGSNENDIWWNRYGVSCIFAETEKGNELLKNCNGISLFPATFERIVENNLPVINARKRDNRTDLFVQAFTSKGLFYAVDKVKTRREKIVGVAKNVIPAATVIKMKRIIKHI